jgi:hypothetical protein
MYRVALVPVVWLYNVFQARQIAWVEYICFFVYFQKYRYLRFGIILLGLFLTSSTVRAQFSSIVDDFIKSNISLNDSALSRSLSEKGMVYFDADDEISKQIALLFFEKSLEYAKRSNYIQSEINNYLRIALVYEKESKNLAIALDLLNFAQKRLKAFSFDRGEFGINNLFATIYFKQGQYKDGLLAAMATLKVAERMKLPEGIFFAHISIGRVLGRMKRVKQAETHFQIAESLLDTLKNPGFANDVYRDWSRMYVENNLPVNAKIQLNKWQIVLDTTKSVMYIDWLKAHSAINGQLNQWKAAYTFQKRVYRVENNVRSEAAARSMDTLRVRLQTKQKIFENQLLAQENQNQKLWLVVLAIALGLIGALTILVATNASIRKKLQDQKALSLQREQDLLKSKLELQSNEALRQEQLSRILEAQNEVLVFENKLKEESLAKAIQEIEFERERADLEKKLLEARLAGAALRLAERKSFIEQILVQLDTIKALQPNRRVTAIESLQKALKLDNLQDRGWEEFAGYFESVHSGFFDRLKAHCPTLTSNEMRLAALIRAKRTGKEIAELLGVAHSSVNTARYRLKKKLLLVENDDLDHWLSLV